MSFKFPVARGAKELCLHGWNPSPGRQRLPGLDNLSQLAHPSLYRQGGQPQGGRGSLKVTQRGGQVTSCVWSSGERAAGGLPGRTRTRLGPGAAGAACRPGLAGTAEQLCRGGTRSWAARRAARETACFPGSKILIFPFLGRSITRLPLLFLLPFSSGRFLPRSFPPVTSLPAQARCCSSLHLHRRWLLVASQMLPEPVPRRPRLPASPVCRSSARWAQPASAPPRSRGLGCLLWPRKVSWLRPQVTRLVSAGRCVTEQAVPLPLRLACSERSIPMNALHPHPTSEAGAICIPIVPVGKRGSQRRLFRVHVPQPERGGVGI